MNKCSALARPRISPYRSGVVGLALVGGAIFPDFVEGIAKSQQVTKPCVDKISNGKKITCKEEASAIVSPFPSMA
jgi:hypothetical protein